MFDYIYKLYTRLCGKYKRIKIDLKTKRITQQVWLSVEL